MEFIEWCNNNQGFLSAVLSLLTIIISVIAVWVSIRIAYIPYKKNIILDSIFLIKKDKYFLKLTIANSGNRLIGIKYIIVEYKNIDVGAISKIKFVEPSKMKPYYINTNLNIEDTKFDKEPKVKIKIGDIEGKEYKFERLIAMG